MYGPLNVIFAMPSPKLRNPKKWFFQLDPSSVASVVQLPITTLEALYAVNVIVVELIQVPPTPSTYNPTL